VILRRWQAFGLGYPFGEAAMLVLYQYVVLLPRFRGHGVKQESALLDRGASPGPV
jgi:hypothetical protein